MGGCFSRPRRVANRRPNSTSSSFYCTGIRVGSMNNIPSLIDFENAQLQPISSSSCMSAPPAIVQNNLNFVPGSPSKRSSAASKVIDAPQCGSSADSITQSTEEPAPTPSSTTFSATPDLRLFSGHASGRQLPYLADLAASLKRRGVVGLSAEQLECAEIPFPMEGNSDTSPRSSFQRHMATQAARTEKQWSD